MEPRSACHLISAGASARESRAPELAPLAAAPVSGSARGSGVDARLRQARASGLADARDPTGLRLGCAGVQPKKCPLPKRGPLLKKGPRPQFTNRELGPLATSSGSLPDAPALRRRRPGARSHFVEAIPMVP